MKQIVSNLLLSCLLKFEMLVTICLLQLFILEFIYGWAHRDGIYYILGGLCYDIAVENSNKSVESQKLNEKNYMKFWYIKI